MAFAVKVVVVDVGGSGAPLSQKSALGSRDWKGSLGACMFFFVRKTAAAVGEKRSNKQNIDQGEGRLNSQPSPALSPPGSETMVRKGTGSDWALPIL